MNNNNRWMWEWWIICLSCYEIDGVRKEKERLTAVGLDLWLRGMRLGRWTSVWRWTTAVNFPVDFMTFTLVLAAVPPICAPGSYALTLVLRWEVRLGPLDAAVRRGQLWFVFLPIYRRVSGVWHVSLDQPAAVPSGVRRLQYEPPDGPAH